MANRKVKPIEGEVCWFCKQPADHDSWMGLGFLKSTTKPMFEGNYILYHEPCAVYSNGAGDLPPEGMDDDNVLKFWLHGERCSGIGLKCQLCGLKGATTGCLHGPCQQFYHYPCARARAAQGHLQFSLQCRALACEKHLSLLPHPAEDQFLGMWMEGGGSWNGGLVQAAAASWLPHYATHMRSFHDRWQHLLTMTPMEQLKQQQQAKKRKSSRGGRGSNSGDSSDPEFRVKRRGDPRSSTGGGRSRQPQSQLQQQCSGGGGGSLVQAREQRLQQQQQQQQQSSRPRQRQQQPQVPQRLGVPPEIAQAALLPPAQQQAVLQAATQQQAANRSSTAATAARAGLVLVNARPSDDGELGAGSAQQQQQEQEPAAAGYDQPTLDCELLLQAAGFTSPLVSQLVSMTQQGAGSVKLEPEAIAGALAAAVSELTAAAVPGPGAAAANGTTSRTASGAAKAAAASSHGASSADSAPASSSRRGGQGAAAPAGDGAANDADDGEAEVQREEGRPLIRQPFAQQQQQCGGSGGSAGGSCLEDFPVRKGAPTPLRLPSAAGAAAAAAAAGTAGAAGAAVLPAESSVLSDGGMSFSGGMFQGPAGGVDSSSVLLGSGRRRKYLDVNLYMTTGQKVLSYEPIQQPAAAAGTNIGRPHASSRSLLDAVPSSSGGLSRGAHVRSAPPAPPARAAGVGAAGPPLGVGVPLGGGARRGGMPTPAPPPVFALEGWPSDRGTDMFSWLQQQAKQQQLQGSEQRKPAMPGAVPGRQRWGLDLSSDKMDGQSLGTGRAGAAAAPAAAGGGGGGRGSAAAAAGDGSSSGNLLANLVGSSAGDAAAAAAAAVAAAAAAAGMAGDGSTQRLLDAVVRAAQSVGKGNHHHIARESSTQVPALSLPARSGRSPLPSPRAALISPTNNNNKQQQQQRQGGSVRSPLPPLPSPLPLSPQASLGGSGSPVLQQMQKLQLLHQQQQQQQRGGAHGGGLNLNAAAALTELAQVLRKGAQQMAVSNSGAAAAAVPAGQQLSLQAGMDAQRGMKRLSTDGENQQQQQQTGLQSMESLQSMQSQGRAAWPSSSLGVVSAGSGGSAGAAAAAAIAAANAGGGGAGAAAGLALPRITEYFGCVTSLPVLQSGELRAAGVTAHPNVVAGYVKQGLDRALTLQPWSIVVPPSTIRQLGACNVQPSQLASQLYSLLHASNVLNNHTTNGGGAGRAGGSSGLSGGYAGMPQDLPVRYVRGCLVEEGDRRAGLVGEFTLTALQDLDAGTVLGPWRSYAMTHLDYAQLMKDAPPDWQAPPGVSRQHAWMELLHKYTIAVKVPALQSEDPYGSVLASSSNAPMLYFCALGHGNLTCLVNDPVLDPLAAAKSPEAERIMPPNVEVCVVLVNGLPLPLLITVRSVKAGEEVCYGYGKAYWHAWASLKAAMAQQAANGALQGW